MDLRLVDDASEWGRFWGETSNRSALASHGYVAAAAGLEEGGAPLAAVLLSGDGDFLFHPFIKRPIDRAPGHFDLISAYDFGGFWFSTDDRDRRRALSRAFERAFSDYAVEAGIVCEFIRVHPFTDPALPEASGYALRHHADNVVVDLERGCDATREGYSRSRRKQVRQGTENGLSVTIARSFDVFTRMYHETLDRLGAQPFYYFDRTFFESISEHLVLVHVRDPTGAPCAAHAYLADGEVLFAYLCVADAGKRALRPNCLAYDWMIEEACRRGFRWLHLGGGAPSLRAYKASFSPKRVPYYHATRIFDEAVYSSLVDQRAGENDLAAAGTFFPGYRAAEQSPKESSSGVEIANSS